MIAVIFELKPHMGKSRAYFDIAASLAQELQEIDGFLSVERFESKSEPGKFLSLSFWRDEAAVKDWRNQQAHRLAQATGRETIFAGYRLRVAEVIRDYGLDQREQIPDDSRAFHAKRSI